MKGEKFPWRTLCVALIVCAGGSLQRGYQLTIINPSEHVFRKFINETTYDHYGEYLSETSHRIVWSLMVNMAHIGSIFGSLPLRSMTEKLGRRRSFYVSTAITLLGLILQAISKVAESFELFAAGRFIVGFGTGLSLALEGVYFNEIAPIESRGFFCSLTGAAIQLGFVFGACMALEGVLGTDDNWPYLFVLEIGPVLALMVAIKFLRESPKYLWAKGRVDSCKSALVYFGHSDVEGGLHEIETEIQGQKRRLKWRDIWNQSHFRKATWLGIVVVTASGMSGAVYIHYFSTSILKRLGMTRTKSQYGSVGIMLMFFLASVLGIFVSDKIGRRVLLLFSIAGMALMNVALMVFGLIYDYYVYPWSGYASIAACVVFAFIYGIGMSDLQWTITPELVPLNARLPVQTIVMTTQKIVALIAGIAFYPLQLAIGHFCFLLYIIPLCVCFVILAKQFPETKQKPVVEVMKSLGYRGDGSDMMSK